MNNASRLDAESRRTVPPSVGRSGSTRQSTYDDAACLPARPPATHKHLDGQSRNQGVRRILVRAVNAPLPPEAKKILKVRLRNGALSLKYI